MDRKLRETKDIHKGAVTLAVWKELIVVLNERLHMQSSDLPQIHLELITYEEHLTDNRDLTKYSLKIYEWFPDLDIGRKGRYPIAEISDLSHLPGFLAHLVLEQNTSVGNKYELPNI